MKMPIPCFLCHVKGHQDDMHKKGLQGPLTRDTFWNIHMDKKAKNAQLHSPTLPNSVFGSSSAIFIHKGKPIHTKNSQTIRSALLDPPLQQYTQQKEQ